MKHYILKICILVSTSFYSISSYSQNIRDKYMIVSADKIEVDGKLCYLVKKGYSFGDTINYVPFCGLIDGLYYEKGFEYTLEIERFDINLDTIRVIRTISSFNRMADDKRLQYIKRKQTKREEK